MLLLLPMKLALLQVPLLADLSKASALNTERRKTKSEKSGAAIALLADLGLGGGGVGSYLNKSKTLLTFFCYIYHSLDPRRYCCPIPL
jgi:hypothetical protein